MNEYSRGTTFWVELKCEAADRDEEILTKENRDEASSADNDHLLSGKCFLVVEDNSINAEILCGLLAMYGAKSVVRSNGIQAVQAFLEAPQGAYAAILMDIQMPEMNGYEASKKIRKIDRPDASQIPIINMTANAFAEDVQVSMNAGMNAHVSKPIDVDVLRITLSRVLEHA